MIIENQNDVTTAVLAELARAPNARFREIMSVFVRHLHDFVREAKLSVKPMRCIASNLSRSLLQAG